MSAFAVTLNERPPTKSCLMVDLGPDIQTKSVDLNYLLLSLDKLSCIAIDEERRLAEMKGNFPLIFN